MLRILRFGILVTIVLTQVGCASKFVTSERVGECAVLARDQEIWDTSSASGYMGHVMLSSSPFAPTAYGFDPNKVGQVLAGTKVELYEFTVGADGSFGRFLRTKVKIVDGPFSGVIADIPSCVPFHPQPRWTLNCSLNPEQLHFDPGILKACE